MTGLETLWLPLLLSSVFVFITSSVIHMLSPWRKGDFKTALNQDAYHRSWSITGSRPSTD